VAELVRLADTPENVEPTLKNAREPVVGVEPLLGTERERDERGKVTAAIVKIPIAVATATTSSARIMTNYREIVESAGGVFIRSLVSARASFGLRIKPVSPVAWT
jgi:hypothetical protein